MSMREQIVLIKQEATPGTYESMVGSDAIQTGEFIPNVQNFERASRDLISGLPGMSEPDIMVLRKTTMEIPAEFAGSGTPGTAPGIDKLLLAAGFSKAIVAGASVTYTLANTSGSSARYSARTGIAGQAYSMKGALGSKLALEFGANGFGKLTGTIEGMYVDPVDVANLTPIFPAQAAPVPFNSTGVAGGSAVVAGYAACVNTFSWNLENTQRFDDGAGCQNPGMSHTDRKVSGSITITRPSLSAKNFFTQVAGSTTGAIVLPIGTVAGNIATINLPRVQFGPAQLVDVDGDPYLTMEWTSLHKVIADMPSFVFT